MKSDLMNLIQNNNTISDYENQLNFCIISNINTEPYFCEHLTQIFLHNKIKVNCIYIYLDYLANDKLCKEIKSSDLIIIWLNLEELYPNYINDILSGKLEINNYVINVLNLYEAILSKLILKSSAEIIGIGLEDFYLNNDIYAGKIIDQYQIADELNYKIHEKFDIELINLKKILAYIGLKECYDTKSKYRWSSPYSRLVKKQVAYEINNIFLKTQHISPKCIVLDCDNVLWGGVLIEDGISNIKLGEQGIGHAYQDFQRFILQLYQSGIILALCSKNDYSDIKNVFDNHKGMILKMDYIASCCINWNNKDENILCISKELNIGLDSMVFVDDSDFEINLVKNNLPEVSCIKFDIFSYADKFSLFKLQENINKDDIKHRNDYYITNNLRRKLRNNSNTYDDYLKQLNSKIEIHKACENEIGRVSELTLRAHKFTNGKSYNLIELTKLFHDINYDLYCVYLSDKFSDLGLVASFGIINKKKLDLFVMSCRANGRKLEDNMLDEIKSKYDIKDVFFKSTNKNQSVADWLRTLHDEERRI